MIAVVMIGKTPCWTGKTGIDIHIANTVENSRIITFSYLTTALTHSDSDIESGQAYSKRKEAHLICRSETKNWAVRAHYRFRSF
jgi:hypothetical protein